MRQLLDAATIGCANYWMKQLLDACGDYWMRELLGGVGRCSCAGTGTIGCGNYWMRELLNDVGTCVCGRELLDAGTIG